MVRGAKLTPRLGNESLTGFGSCSHRVTMWFTPAQGTQAPEQNHELAFKTALDASTLEKNKSRHVADPATFLGGSMGRFQH